MLSYQHAYHAGNHGDILKHYVLSFVISSLNKKEKPYTFFDTHSGSGLYDLLDNRNLKTGEGEKGIVQLISKITDEDRKLFSESDCFAEFQKYIGHVQKYLDCSLYPGSPQIEKDLLRKQDFLVLSELHPQEIENLKENLGGKSLISKKVKINPSIPLVQIHHRSGWEMIKALTPPKTSRGAVLIDPSYEENQDYVDAADAILSVNKKWNNGIILLWYPLLAHRMSEIEGMKEKIISGIKQNNPNVEYCDLQLCVNTKDSHKEESLEQNTIDRQLNKNPPRMYGSGMLVINAPWKLKENGDTVIKFIEEKLFIKA